MTDVGSHGPDRFAFDAPVTVDQFHRPLMQRVLGQCVDELRGLRDARRVRDDVTSELDGFARGIELCEFGGLERVQVFFYSTSNALLRGPARIELHGLCASQGIARKVLHFHRCRGGRPDNRGRRFDLM